MNAWRPIPRALITEVGSNKYSRENPASRLVGFCWALDQLMDGYPPSVRDLARFAGWTTWQARTMLERVRSHAAEWNGPRQSHTLTAQIPQSPRTPEPSYSNGLPEPPAQVPHSTPPDSAHRVRGSTPQDNDNTEINMGGVGTKVDRCWHRLESIRLKHSKRGRRRKLGEHHHNLSLLINRYSEGELLHAWIWWWESGHHIPDFCKQKNLDYGTFLNPSNHKRYQTIAEKWTPGESITSDISSFLDQADTP